MKPKYKVTVVPACPRTVGELAPKTLFTLAGIDAVYLKVAPGIPSHLQQEPAQAIILSNGQLMRCKGDFPVQQVLGILEAEKNE